MTLVTSAVTCMNVIFVPEGAANTHHPDGISYRMTDCSAGHEETIGYKLIAEHVGDKLRKPVYQ